MRLLLLVTTTIICSQFLLNLSAHAQEGGGGSNQPSGHAFSVHTGPLLPKNFPPLDEIMRSFGVRYGLPIGPKSHVELSYTGSNTDGVTYQDLGLGLRGEIPFEDMTVLGLIGADLLRTKSPTGDDGAYYASYHIGGGLLASITREVFLRMEMRFNLHPGIVLFFGFGFEFRFGGAGGGG